MIEIVNKKDDSYVENPETDLYVGRPSVFGNPFIIGRDGTRDNVVNLYRVYLAQHLSRSSGSEDYIFAQLMKLAREHKAGKTVRLVCYCAPKKCHAEIIKAWIEKFAENIKDETA